MASRPRTGASRAARLAAVVVAIGAAALSFRATAAVAEQTGAVTPGWGWIVPLVIEAGVLTAAALAWVRSGDGVPAAREVTVMTALLVLSVVVNVAHAAHGTMLGRVIAGVPPLVLLAAVEGLLREQRRNAALAARESTSVHVGSSTLAPTTPVDSPVANSAANRPELTSVAGGDMARRQLSRPSDGDTVADARPRVTPAVDRAPLSAPAAMTGDGDLGDLQRRVREAVSLGQSVTGAVVAQWLGCSPRTGSRKLKALTDAFPLLLDR